MLIFGNPLIFFVLFFSITAIAVAFHNTRWIRSNYLVLFFSLVIISGLFGRSQWPFFNWHLYAFRATNKISFYEVRVADQQGNEIKYDARAVPPSLATPIRRFASQILTIESTEARELASFLLKNASLYRHKIGSESLDPWKSLKFPRHQIGFYWTEESLEKMSEFEEIRIYLIEDEFSKDGKHLLQTKDIRVESYR